MKEVFYEESSLIQEQGTAKLKYNVFKILSILSYVIFGFWLFIVFWFFKLFSGNIILNLIFVLIPAVIFFCSGLFLGRMKNKFYVDYDYTFVSGSIRFSKVIKNIKRKFIAKFDSSDIEKLGKYGSEVYEKYSVMTGIDKMILTSNNIASEGKEFFYLVVNKDAVKTLYVLECTETFIVNILKFANKGIIDDEYLKEINKR
ncbi:MAG: hypothetical protein IKB67_01180 [Clostridia bacterium]|nr:hypothetical protein [Clostridia bacterium]